MASQSALFADTIAAMKKAVKRKAYDSEEDEPIAQLTNRGNKLRKHARFVREGQMALPNGPEIYKKTIEHGGYQREIISERPRLLDENGWELDSGDDDEDDEERHAEYLEATELYPYEHVRIERILAPLTSAADLPAHPTLSRPFESDTLTGLTQQACDMVHKEKNSLWKLKRLLRRLCGDDLWMPCEVFETENDIALFGDDSERVKSKETGVSRGRERSLRPEGEYRQRREVMKQGHTQQSESGREDVTMTDAVSSVEGEPKISHAHPRSHVNETNVDSSHATAVASSRSNPAAEDQNGGLEPEDTEMTARPEQSNEDMERAEKEHGEPGHSEDQVEDPVDEEAEPAIPRRMRTRAQAHAASDDTPLSQTRSSTPDSRREQSIHPYFVAPRTSRPDRDFGLPRAEAADARRLLQLYIQKQEEVCRGAQKLYEGLLRADRMRTDVVKWARAEAHRGEMSDGEDWYDREEWRLSADLAKGHDDEEEEAAATNKKTTRARRV